MLSVRRVVQRFNKGEQAGQGTDLIANLGNCMNARKPFVVPALAGLVLFRLKAVQQTAQAH